MDKIINILKFSLLGILLPISIQCMDGKREINDSDLSLIPIVPLDFELIIPTSEAGQNSQARIEALESKIDSLRTSVGVNKELPKAYQVWEIELQYLFYPYCDQTPYAQESWYQKSWAPEGETKHFWYPEETVARLRLHAEETKNLAYSQSTSAQLPFSLQPVKKVDLKNIVGIELEQWLTARERTINDIKIACQDWKYWSESTPGLRYSADQLERYAKASEFYYKTMMLQYASKRTRNKEVIAEDRDPNETEIKDLELKDIHPKTPTVLITSASGYTPFYTSAVGTSYKSTERPELVKGFTIFKVELPRYFEALERRLKSLRREYDILTDVWLFYTKEFLPAVEGWINLRNWMMIASIVKEYRQTIKTKIEEKYPPAEDPTDSELTQSEVKRLRKLTKFLARIRKLTSEACKEDTEQQKATAESDNTFRKVYRGLDDLSEFELGSIDGKGKKTQFQDVTLRNYHSYEEHYEIQMMWKNPSDRSIQKLGNNKIGIFVRDDYVFGDDYVSCVVKNCKELVLNLPDCEFLKGLKNAVEQNKAPSRRERRKLLKFLKKQQYITPKKEPFIVPKGTQMATTFLSIDCVMAHRTAWNEKQEIWNPKTKAYEHLSVFDQIKNQPALEPTFATNVDYNQKYDELSKELRILLNGNDLKIGYIKLLQYMYQPYNKRKTRIPRGWKFFISETYLVPTDQRPELTKIDLSHCSFTDEDLDIKGKNRVFQRLFGCPFLTLSHNTFTGRISYPFTNVVHLFLNMNNLVSLDILCNLKKLVRLNLSNNQVSDLSVFFTKAEENFSSLEELDLSNNKIEDIYLLSKLTRLQSLDVSYNVIASLVRFTQAQPRQSDEQGPQGKHSLRSLKVNGNKLTGPWQQVLPKGLDSLTELDLKENNKLTVYTIDGLNVACFRPYTFRTFYPALKKLSTDKGNVEDLGAQNYLIDLQCQSITDQNIEIDSQSQMLKLTTGTPDKGTKQSDLQIICLTDLNLSNNGLTGAHLPLSKFCSNRIAKLMIAHNNLINIDFIAGLTTLIYLDVSYNSIENVTPLGSCTFLQHLDISNNKLETLVPLEPCKKLVTLIVNGNKLPKLNDSVFPKGLSSVTRLEVKDNPLDAHGWAAFSIYFPKITTLNKSQEYMGENPTHQGSRG